MNEKTENMQDLSEEDTEKVSGGVGDIGIHRDALRIRPRLCACCRKNTVYISQDDISEGRKAVCDECVMAGVNKPDAEK